MGKSNIKILVDYKETVGDKQEILEKPQLGHGILTLLARTILLALVSAFISRINRAKIKTQKSLLKTHESDNNTYSESETEEETEDYKNGNDSNNSSDNSTQTNGIQQSKKESYGIQFKPVGERAYMRKLKGIGGRHRWTMDI